MIWDFFNHLWYCHPSLKKWIGQHFQVLLGLLQNHVRGLQVAVDDVVYLKVFVVVSKRIEQTLRHLDPAHVAQELHYGEEGKVEVGRVRLEGGVSNGDGDVRCIEGGVVQLTLWESIQ